MRCSEMDKEDVVRMYDDGVSFESLVRIAERRGRNATYVIAILHHAGFDMTQYIGESDLETKRKYQNAWRKKRTGKR